MSILQGFLADKILDMIHEKELDLFDTRTRISNAEVIEKYPKSQPLIIVANHIGPVGSKGKSSDDSGFTPDVLLLGSVVELLTQKKPLFIAGVNDEIFEGIPVLQRLPGYNYLMKRYLEFGRGILNRIGMIPVNKMKTIKRENHSFLTDVQPHLEKAETIITFGEGLWRGSDHKFENEVILAKGSAKILLELGVSLLPVIIRTSESFSKLTDSSILIGNLIQQGAELDSIERINQQIAKQWVHLQSTPSLF